MAELFEDLRKRHVLRVGAACLVVAWLVARVADVFFHGSGASPWRAPAPIRFPATDW